MERERRESGHGLPSPDHRSRHVRHSHRASPSPSRDRFHGGREERRRGRDLAREHVPRLSRRQSQPQLQLLVRPAPRLAVLLLDAGRSALVLPRLRRPLRHSRCHSLRDRGEARNVVRGARNVVCRRRRLLGERGDARGKRRGQRSGPAQSPEVPGDRRRGRVRWTRLPLGALGRLGRPARETCRGDRDRRKRDAAHPRDRASGRSTRRVPAHARVDGANTRVPRPRPRRAAMALPSRAVLQRVEPLLHLLAHGRRRHRRGARRRVLGPRQRLGEPRERFPALGAHRVHPGRVPRAPRPRSGHHPHVPPGARSA